MQPSMCRVDSAYRVFVRLLFNMLAMSFALLQNKEDIARGSMAIVAAGPDTRVPVLGWGYRNTGELAAHCR